MNRQTTRIRLNQPDEFRDVTMVAGHGIEVHLDAVAGPDHDIASFGGHSSAFRELKNAGPRSARSRTQVTSRRWWRCP